MYILKQRTVLLLAGAGILACGMHGGMHAQFTCCGHGLAKVGVL